MPATLESLLPEFQEQYNALMPEIERSIREDLNRRGMTYSGEATDALARAQAELLADLAGKSERTRLVKDEAARDRAFRSGEASADRGEARRAQNLSLIGSGLGAATTLGGLAYMNNAEKAKMEMMMRRIGMGAGAPGGAPGGGGEAVSGAVRQWEPGQNMEWNPNSGGAYFTEVNTPQPSMWQRAGGLKGLGAGAGGGMIGNRLAELAGGRSSTAGGVGAGVGGLGGAMAGSKYGWKGAGLGALAGAFGGGLLGNLFA